MLETYFVVSLVLGAITLVVSIIAVFGISTEEDFSTALKGSSMILFGGTVITFLWPVLIAAIIPVGLTYGGFNMAREFKKTKKF